MDILSTIDIVAAQSYRELVELENPNTLMLVLVRPCDKLSIPPCLRWSTWINTANFSKRSLFQKLFHGILFKLFSTWCHFLRKNHANRRRYWRVRAGDDTWHWSRQSNRRFELHATRQFDWRVELGLFIKFHATGELWLHNSMHC